jgi:sulfur-oxidizing protein SoxY
MRMRLVSLIAAVVCVTLAPGPARAEPPVDPLNSPMWKEMAKQLLSSGPIEFDDRVKVVVPPTVENQAQVPITADARAINGVIKLIVFADLNPIQHVLTLTPNKAAAYVSFRLKVEQATPVRAAALTSDGVWHVGGVYLDAAGGGCSATAMARNEADWSETVGQTQGKMWLEADGMSRARFRVRHPMDTGLSKDGIPTFIIEKVDIKDPSGAPMATIEMHEPVSEDPTLTLLLKMAPTDAALSIEGRDNNGSIYKSKLPAPGRQS